MIYEFDKSPYEKIRFEHKIFDGKDLYHIRTYVESRMKDIRYFPTQKGITLTKDTLFEFFKGVDALKEYLLDPDPNKETDKTD